MGPAGGATNVQIHYCPVSLKDLPELTEMQTFEIEKNSVKMADFLFVAGTIWVQETIL